MSSLLNVENNQNNSTAPPGWNDPPPTTTINQSSLNNRIHLHKLRRPVDPSIQSSNSNTPERDLSLTPNNNSHFHQSRSFPQLTKPELLVQGLGTHPGSAFTPTSAGSLLSTANCSSPSMSMGHFAGNSHGTIPPPPVILPASHSQLNIQQLTANSLQSMAPNLPQPLPPFIQSIPTADPSATAILSHSNQQGLPPFYHPVPNGQFNLINQQQIVSEMPSITTMMSGEEATTQSIGQQPMIFSPPNIVPQCRPTTQPIPTDYRTPIKAAGDVSLSGPQLATFLTKAALLLPQGPMCEGILLRIKQFEDLVQTRQISEPCLKKLNFVVDALDRHVYDEAGQFFEQMLVNYTDDCTIGGWAHGIRLLIHELRKTQLPNIRSHSAGTRNH
ncbi:hypothetical protein ACQ4LE_003468 [Meloidogyne hapla]